MGDFVKFLLLGLGVGSVHAIVALGLVLVYRGSGVVNFSQGALALTGSAVFFETHESVGVIPAILLSVITCGLIGVIVQFAIMGPMRGSSPLARLIVTLGLLAVGLEFWDRIYPVIVVPGQFLPDSSVDFGSGIVVPQSRLWLFLISVLLGTGLWLLYRYTRFGLATSAVAENENVAAALGWSPNVVAAANWGLGGALAGFGGALLFGLLGIDPIGHTLIVIPALAAALLGGFKSFPATVASGLLIGVIDSLAILYVTESGFTKGVRQAIPFLLIVLVLVVRGRALPLRSFAADRLPLLGTGRVRWWMVVGCAAFFVLSFQMYGISWTRSVMLGSITAIVCLSLVVLVGFAGQLSLAQWAVAGMGALFAGRVCADIWGLPMLAAIVVGVAMTIPVGILISLPALRVRGVNLAIVTLALAVVIDAMVLRNTKYTADGFVPAVIPDPSIFGFSLVAREHPERFAAFCVIVFALSGLLVANIRRGRVGRRMIAVRGNENAAASLGISVTGVKTYAFAVSSGLAALGGALIAFQSPNLTFESSFPRLRNIDIVLLSVIGGIGHIGGSIIGAMAAIGGVFERIVAVVVDPHGLWALIAGILLILIVMYRPDGAGQHQAEEFQHTVEKVGRRSAMWRLARVFFGLTIISSLFTWVTLDSGTGVSGININEGLIGFVLSIVGLVGTFVAARRLDDWRAGVPIVGLAVAAIWFTTHTAEEFDRGGWWQWAVFGATMAFLTSGYAASSALSAAEDRRKESIDLVGGDISVVEPKVLALEDVTVRFGNVVALHNASLQVNPGEVVGLIGPNGAGKTTLIEATTGFVGSTGRITVDGSDITSLSATQRSRLGIARSFQSLELFEDMTILDNLRTAADDGGLRPYLADLVWPSNPELSPAALAAIDEFGLGDVLDKKPGELPYAKRRTVAIARALAASPSIILLDEPAAGLDSASTGELEVLIRRLADEWGMSVLLIEHDVGLVMRTCDRIVALDFGEVIDTGTPEQIAASEAVIAAYLGAAEEDEVDLASNEEVPA